MGYGCRFVHGYQGSFFRTLGGCNRHGIYGFLPLNYPIGGITGSEKSVSMQYRLVDRKTCVAMENSNKYEKIIVPHAIFSFPQAPLVERIDC